MKVSIFESAKDVIPVSEENLTAALEGIQSGRWIESVNQYRTMVSRFGKDSEPAKAYKVTLPCFTVSGTFSRRELAGLKDHSGFAAVDIDNISSDDLEAFKSLVEADRYCVAVFNSVGNAGLCMIIAVRPTDHLQSRDNLFRGIQDYLYNSYEIQIDKLADFSRLRFVSYDPDLRYNLDYETFIPTTQEERKELSTPQNLTGLFDEQGFFQKACEWVERKGVYFEPGNRHKFVHRLACICNRFGLSESDTEAYVKAAYPHFAQNPSNAISWVYRNLRGEHGTETFKKSHPAAVVAVSTKTEYKPKPASENQAPKSAEDLLFEEFWESASKQSDNPAPPVPYVQFMGSMILSKGNLMTIGGPSKSAKSQSANAICSGFLGRGDSIGFECRQNEEGKAIIWLDSEQSDYNRDKSYRQLAARAGLKEMPNWVKFFSVRKYASRQKLYLLERVLDKAATEFNGIFCFVVDQTADFIGSINDDKESSALVTFFLQAIETYDCIALNVLHQLHNGGKLRGHLGTMLEQKSEAVILAKHEKVIETESEKRRFLSVEFARNAKDNLPSIFFRYDEGKGYFVKDYIGDNDGNDIAGILQMSESLIEGYVRVLPLMTVNELVNYVASKCSTDHAKARKFISEMMNIRGILSLNPEQKIVLSAPF